MRKIICLKEVYMEKRFGWLNQKLDSDNPNTVDRTQLLVTATITFFALTKDFSQFTYI